MAELNLSMILTLLFEELNVSNKEIAEWLDVAESTATKLRKGKLRQAFDVKYLYDTAFARLPARFNNMPASGFLRDVLIPSLKNIGCYPPELARHANDSYESFAQILLTLALKNRGSAKAAAASTEVLSNECHLVGQDYHLSAFMGRDDVIEAIRKKLETAHVAVLSGIGGIGKSYAAIRYAERYQNQYVNIQRVFYDSDIRHTVSKLMFENLHEGQQSEEELFQNRLKALYRFDKSTLLILDNMDEISDYENLKALLRSRIHMIITTRLRGHGLEDYLIHIDKLAAEDQMALFEHHLGRKVPQGDKSSVEDIFAQVGGHTLLIELIAKTIRNSDMTPAEMLAYLRGDDKAPFDEVEISKDDRMLQETMDQYVSRLFNINALNAEAVQALMFLTLVPLKGVQRVLFKKLGGFRNNSGVLLLAENSWVITDENDPAGPRIRLHPVICTVARQKTAPDFESCRIFLQNLLKKCSDGELTETEKEDLKGVARTILTAVSFTPGHDEEVGYLSDFAKAMWDRCCYKEALEIYQFTLNDMVLKAAVNDACSHSRATLHTRIAELYTRLADYESSISHYQQAIRITEKTCGEESLEVAGLYNDIGFLFRKKSDYETALIYLKKAMDIREKHPETNPLDLAVTYNDIGVVYINMEDYREAGRYYAKALELRKGNPQAAPQDLAYSYHNLGTVAQREGRFDAAIANHEAALKLRKAAFGEEHPDVSASLNQMGIDYMSRKNPGDLEIAWEYFQQALAIRKKILGESHPDTAWTLFSISLWYISQGADQEAAKALEQVIGIRQKTIGAQHLYTADARYHLGVVYGRMGRIPEAIAELSMAEEIQSMKGADKSLAKTKDALTAVHQGSGTACKE